MVEVIPKMALFESDKEVYYNTDIRRETVVALGSNVVACA